MVFLWDVSLQQTSGIVTAGSQRLVSGESLMNDGTAIVVFVLMLKAQ